MKTGLIIYCFLALFILSSCSNANDQGTPDSGSEIANPASVFCEENQGIVDIREGEEGQVGFCVFEDGSECEEWAYFRGECQRISEPAEGCHEGLAGSCCVGEGEGARCVSVDVDCILGYEPKFFGCVSDGVNDCVPKMDCVPSN